MIRKYAEIFCWKNVSSFCSAEATYIFSAKNIRILYIESAKTVNEITFNELVKLTTLWTTVPRILQLIIGFVKPNWSLILLNVLKFWTLYSILFVPKFCFLCSCILIYLHIGMANTVDLGLHSLCYSRIWKFKRDNTNLCILLQTDVVSTQHLLDQAIIIIIS